MVLAQESPPFIAVLLSDLSRPSLPSSLFSLPCSAPCFSAVCCNLIKKNLLKAAGVDRKEGWQQGQGGGEGG